MRLYPSLLVGIAILACLLAPSSNAQTTFFGPRAPERPAPQDTYHGGGRVGGDTIEDAVEIEIPFSDTGNTCGYANDYDWACPDGGSTAPDVVYKTYVASSDLVVSVELCASSYDTKVYVYQDAVGTPIACSDDAGCGYSGYQSWIYSLSLAVGHFYYFVVDGWGSSCGDYAISVVETEPCDLVCPPGALVDQEPPCVDGYFDAYNGGCQYFGWTPIIPEADGCRTVCARSCTYEYNGWDYRDTDWYVARAAGDWVTLSGSAEFPFLLILIWGDQCNNLQYIYDRALPCQSIDLQWYFPPGANVWVWASPSVFSGVPESDYIMEICGVSPFGPLGACCVWEVCHLATEENCDGLWIGTELDCDPNPCGASAACCLTSGECMATFSECRTEHGWWRFPVELCEPDPCSATPVLETTWGRVKTIFRR